MLPREIRALPPSPVLADFLDTCTTLSAAIEELAGRFPDYECLTLVDRRGGEERTTLSSLWARGKSAQALFESHGLRPGDHAVLILPTGSDLISSYFGVIVAGGVPAVMAGPSNRISDHSLYVSFLGRVLAKSGARFVLCDENLAAMLRDAGSDALAGAVVLSRSQIVDLDSSAFPATVAVTADDIATIQYSSGTTGVPKGVMLTHRAMLSYLRLLRDGAGFRPEDVNVNWIPLYHDMGLFGAFLLPLLCGFGAVLIPTMEFLRSPVLWFWALHRYRGAVSWAPNFAYSLCAKRIQDEDLEGLDLSSWRMAFSASEPVLAHTIENFEKRFAPYGYHAETMTPSWGMAETVMAVAAHPIGEKPVWECVDRDVLAARQIAKPVANPKADGGTTIVATGRALPHVKLQIRDPETGERLPDRHVGQLWVSGSFLFKGYKNDPELTARMLRDGWFDTGDRAYLVDLDLYFVSREKDLIVIGGEKYAPHDVEEVINTVAGVRQGCAVAFGVMNAETGTEDLGAVVETKLEEEGALADLGRALRREVIRSLGLAIRHLHLVPPGGIEKTTSGKLARSATRARYPEVFGDDGAGDGADDGR
jgi:acyl-CoA synthetase (AMP-forming)/AMP-acid ligase II